MRFKHAMRHVIALLSTFFLSIVGSLILWTIIFSIALQGNTTVVMTGSMEPGVSVGDIAISQKMDYEGLSQKVQPGHVLLFKNSSNEDQLVTHRITQKVMDENGALDYFVTKGDANRTEDSGHVYPEDVVGVERILIPMIGLPIQGIKTGNFIPALVFFVLVSLAFITTREEVDRVRANSPNMDPPSDSPQPKSKIKKYVANSVAVVAIIGVIVSSSIVMASAQAEFTASTKNNACTFRSASTFATDPNAYVKGADAASYCWNDATPPSSTNLNIPINNPSTGVLLTDASFISTYDANKFGFNWKLTFPTTRSIVAGDTLRITITDAHGQSLVYNRAITVRYFTGTTRIPVSGNVTVKAEIFKSAGSLAAAGTIIIKPCINTVNPTGITPTQFCSTTPLVSNKTFAVTLTDVANLGRAPITVPVLINYSNSTSANYSITMPAGSTTTGGNVVATNAANASYTSSGTYTAPRLTGTISLNNTGTAMTFKINTTRTNRNTPDWTGTFVVNYCGAQTDASAPTSPSIPK